MAKRPNAPADDWIFPNKMGTGPKEYVNILRRKVQPKAKELKLPHVTWRLLRHWHSTVLQDSGIPVKVARKDWAILDRTQRCGITRMRPAAKPTRQRR
jgi:integrase